MPFNALQAKERTQEVAAHKEAVQQVGLSTAAIVYATDL